MNSQQRRDAILKLIQQGDIPISASALAKQFHVSRQLIVGDIALLRAQGCHIIATPRGYLYEQRASDQTVKTIAVCHRSEELNDEIYTIVDLGGALLDVIVEHPLYGELRGSLHIYSRYDADQFFNKLADKKAVPLSSLTDGIHLHTIRVHDEACYERILDALRDKGYLYEKG